MAIFPEFFRSCDICNKNLYHEKMALTIEAEVENTHVTLKAGTSVNLG